MKPEDNAARYYYLRARTFINILRRTSHLTPQQRDALRAQAVQGDLDGAWKGYREIMGDTRRGG